MASMHTLHSPILLGSIVATCFVGGAWAGNDECVYADGHTRYIESRSTSAGCGFLAVAADGASTTMAPASAAPAPRPPHLPMGFRGDSFLELFAAMERTDKGSAVARPVGGTTAPVLGPRVFRFVVPAELNPGVAGQQREVAALRYDADAQVMIASLWSGRQMFRVSAASPSYNTVLLARNWQERSYTGQNMLGATTRVTAVRTDEYGLALANITTSEPTALVSSTIPMRIDSARDAAADLAFYLDVRLKPANGSQSGLLGDAVRQRATMSDPYDSIITQRFLLAEVVEAGIFRRSTGEILTWKTFGAAHEDDCVGGACPGDAAPPDGARRFD